MDRYTWVDLGSSYLLGELPAGFLLGQLEARERIQATRSRIWRRYKEELGDWATRNGVQLPHVPAGCDHPSHLFYLILPSPEDREALASLLAARGILTAFHYQPLHLSRMGRRLEGRPGDSPVAEEVSDRLLRLPLFCDLTDTERGEVVEALRAFRPCARP